MKRGYAPKQRYMVRFICVFRREAYKLLCETALSIASDDVGLKRIETGNLLLASLMVKNKRGAAIWKRAEAQSPDPLSH